MDGDSSITRGQRLRLEYAPASPRGGGAWSIVALGLALAGLGYAGWIVGQVWWHVSRGTPVEVVLNWEWFVLPVLAAGVSVSGWWLGRRRWMATCAILLSSVSAVTLLLLRGRW